MDSKLAIKQLMDIEKMANGREIRLAAEWDEPWKILIAIILSAQNRDSRTIAVCEELFKKYPTPSKLGSARLSSIEKIIKSINYYKTKARNIKASAKIISDEGIGNSVDEIIRLPGVGRKTANVYLSEIGKDAVGVDTHVKRISFKLGWTKNKKPDKIEKDLMDLFPRKYWSKINEALVKFGQEFGRSKNKENAILTKLIN